MFGVLSEKGSPAGITLIAILIVSLVQKSTEGSYSDAARFPLIRPVRNDLSQLKKKEYQPRHRPEANLIRLSNSWHT